MTTLKDWLTTFWRILISPTSKTFLTESEKAENKFGGAVGWSVFIAFYSYLLPLAKGYTFNITILIYMLLIFPLLVVLVPSATHFVLQRVFRQKQYLYDKILYIFTAILVLFQLIIAPITFFAPSNIARIANYAVIAYQFLLLVIAVKAVARIKYWQAIIATLSSVAVGATIFICGLPFITSIIGGVNRTVR